MRNFTTEDVRTIREFLKFLRECRTHGAISIQQFKTIKGQAINGDLAGAKKGLTKLLNRKGVK